MFHATSVLLIVFITFVLVLRKEKPHTQPPPPPVQEQIDFAYFDKDETLWVLATAPDGKKIFKKAYGDQHPLHTFKDIHGFEPPK